MPPPAPVPEPFADLLRRLAAEAQTDEHGWLFPGKLAGQPITYRTLSHQLRQLGSRSSMPVSRRCGSWFYKPPAPVVADALGFHQKSTARQVANAGATWNRDAAGDHNTRPGLRWDKGGRQR